MKRKSLLFFLLIALLAPLAMNGQQTAVLNDGTTTMSYVPFYGLYADYGAKGQFIIPATDLANKGITSGCQISKLKFFSNATSSGTFFGTSVKVEVGEVSYTSFSSNAFVTSGLTTVLSGTSLSRSSDGTMVVSFSSNYTYTGGNLLISIGGYGSGCPSTTWLGISSTNAGVYGYNSSNSATIPSSTRGTTSYAPKTEITYIPGNTPYITLDPTAATVFTGFTQTLTATYGNVSGTPTITYSSSDTSVATVSGSGATATVTAVAPGTATITATMNGSYTATCAITVEDPSYCTPNPTSRDGKGITAVTFGTGSDVVNNSNSDGLPTSSPFYGDYTSMVGSIEPGTTATVSITYTTGSSTYYNYGTLIWVDWNKDYTFDDSEIVFEGQSSQNSNPSGPHTLNATFTVPANQAADDYRMRIAGADSYFDRYLSGYSDGAHDACFSSTYAVCHDYTLRVAAASNCPTPTITNIAVTDHEAVISTDSDAENFNVQYRVVSEPATSTTYDFEDGTSQGWTTYDNDGDGYSWGVSNQLGSSSGGQTYVDSHGGDYYIVSSYNDEAYAENWLISPQFKLGGSISFYVKRLRNSNYDDYYRVYVSTTGTNISDFSEITTSAIEPGFEYELKTFDLSSYSGQGYVAIKHFANAYDQAYIFLDDITIVEGEDQNPWQTTNDLTLTGLSSGTTYEVQVQANCGATDGLSGWSSSATFTTIDNCAVPTGLTAEVTGNAAELSWAGYADTYDIHYREVDPTAPATIILNVPSDIWNDGSGYQMLLDADATAYGDVFSATGGWTATNYSAFEYLIPTDAECSADATHFVFENSVSIQIPAGTYDWCIVNPSPGDKIYIAAQNGNVGGRQDDYVFEAGKTYEFVPSLYGQNDGVDVTITDNNEWTLVEGVTNPYTLYNLKTQTQYEVQVQGANCDNWSETVTFTTGVGYVLHIDGYSDSSNGWYLIASPIGDVPIENVTNLNANQFDLYYFDQTQQPYEWINYYQGSDPNFNSLQKGKGYLYANSGDVDLVFNGTAYNQNGDVTLVYSEENSDSNMWGWNLIGNPFAEEATIVEWEYMRMNDEHNEIILYDGLHSPAVAPMEGIFVHATKTGSKTVTFTKSSKGNTTTNGDRIMINISQDQKVIDRAAVRFSEGQQLPKYQLNQNSTKVYIPVDGEDFAVVRSEGVGELPVNFKAQENGNYTLSLNTEMNFGYLHLVDNMTGNDVDMLANPSYSFEARTTDYSQRFKLVFATGDNANDNFAYFSNGSFVINNEGNATLQVIDITGRIIKSESINGCANVNVNAASGIYMIRLINGDNVKVQKVFVK